MNHPSSNAVVPRILVADDSDTIQKVVRIALSRQPLKIEVASSWLDASGKVGSGIALLLLDVNLPGVGSDPARLKEVVASAGAVPILVMQGSHDRSLSEATLKECGISHVIQKPFDSNELIGMVTGLAGLSKSALAFSGSEQKSAPPPAPAASAILAPPSPATPASSENMFDIGELPPIPADLIDTTRKGKKAFDIAPEDLFNLVPPPPPPSSQRMPPAPPSHFPPPPPPPPSDNRAVSNPAPVDDMGKQVRQAVEDYCERHFRSLAIEVITAELRRLADEKARHLVDI
jgi:DNA-binding response OmpR family regulator